MTRKKGLIGLLIVCFLVLVASTALAAHSQTGFDAGRRSKTTKISSYGAGLPDGFLD